MSHLCRISCKELPVVYKADYIMAKKPFVHVDRTADFHVMIYLKYGKMTIMEDATEYELLPGSIFFLKKGVHHFGEKRSAPNTAWYYVHFNGDACEDELPFSRNAGQLLNREALTDADYQVYFEIPKLLLLKEEYSLEEALKNLIDDFHSADYGKIWKCSRAFADILIRCCELAEAPKRKPGGNRHIAKIIQYLEEHETEPFSIKKVGQAIGLNEKYVSELFKKETGQLLRDYSTNLKIRKAERLLYQTDLSIAEISEYLGYSDQFYFSNVFKKRKGISPGRFRRENTPPI